MAKSGAWRIEFDNNGVGTATAIEYGGNSFNIERRGLTISLAGGFFGRFHPRGLEIWCVDYATPIEYFISNLRKDQDYFFSFLATYYPHDLNFLLFHPELFSAEFNP